MSTSVEVTEAVARPTRREHDLLGDRNVPAEAYYGIHTLRAKENFAISGTPIGKFGDLISGLAAVKQAAAETNRKLHLLDDERADAILSACREVRAGKWSDHFIVDAIQGGAGTSTNMNANEVIANRALEILGYARGDYTVLHPLEHVNLSQSTNDAYPTAVKIALMNALTRLQTALTALGAEFAAKAIEFADHVKMGRTQLQDAVPMTLGQEFGTYAVMIGEDAQRLIEAAQLAREINLGGTAVGTGINSDPGYPAIVCAELRAITGLDLVTAPDLVEATQDVGSFVQISGTLKRCAVKLSKICNDLRLLSSGPRAGLGEINLPAVQAGSSIMPGKVNPVIPEVVNQVAFEVAGNDVAITMAAESGQLQLNAFEPLIACKLFESITHLTAACSTLATLCVPGITANVEHMRRTVEQSISLITALNPHIGYDAASALASQALVSQRSIIELVVESGLLTQGQLETILSPDNLVRPRAMTAEN
ncbi:aspartate ammonia-lyase [Rhodococcus sp. NPDC055024]